jgi:hypothetical protein
MLQKIQNLHQMYGYPSSSMLTYDLVILISIWNRKGTVIYVIEWELNFSQRPVLTHTVSDVRCYHQFVR